MNNEIELRKVEVLRNNVWIIVRLQEVKKGERFRMYDDDKLFQDKEWEATSDGFLYDIVKGIGGIEAE